MHGPHNILRLIQTGATFERTGAMRVALDALEAPKSLRIGLRMLSFPFRIFGKRGDISQPPVLRAIVALGPAYVKFGQLMSTRSDIVGEELAKELSVLQDQVPSFSQEVSRQIIEEELGIKIDEVFSTFSEPIAAASIAQVHKATFFDGREVAIKVLRPGVEKLFLRDVAAFHLLASIIEFFTPASRRLKPKATVDNFENLVKTELDLRNEAAFGSLFGANTKNDDGFFTADIIWSCCARRVLTTSWMNGEPLSDYSAIDRLGVSRQELAKNLLHHFLTHSLRDGFFHGDLHQGNLMIYKDGGIGALDYGIMGTLDKKTRLVYAQILYGFLNRDYERIAEVHFDAGYVPKTEDPLAFATALRSIGEPIFGQKADVISMATLLQRLFEITERFQMETRLELVLLQRTMVVVEGVARSIDPDINIWEAARPAVERYIRDSLSPINIIKDNVRELERLVSMLPELPEKIQNLSTQPEKREVSFFWKGTSIGLVTFILTYLLLS